MTAKSLISAVSKSAQLNPVSFMILLPAAFENLNIQIPTVNNSKEFDSMLSVNTMRPLCAVIDSAESELNVSTKA